MKRKFAIIFVIILVMIIIGAALYMLIKSSSFISNSKTPKTNAQRESVVKQDKMPIEEDFPDANYEANGKWFGLCKKHSIRSIDDFRKIVSNDPVLKAHFANFNWDNARIGKLEKSTRAYVDYRKNDTIFRKRTAIALPAGDEYITDGNIMVRTNCCNSYYIPTDDLDAEPAAGPSQLTVTPNNPFAQVIPNNSFSPEPIQTLPPLASTATPGSNSAIPLPPPVSPPPGYDPPGANPTETKTPLGATAGSWVLVWSCCSGSEEN